MKYRIVIFPSTPVQDEANALRKRYDPYYNSIDPHITLISDFASHEQTVDSLHKDLDKIAQETNPFTVHISKVSSFTPVTNTIYFKIEQSHELTTLYHSLHDSISSNTKETSFVPHITVARELNDDEYSDVFGTLQMKKIDIEDMIDCFHLCYEDDNGAWEIKSTFKLGQTKEG